jgi:lipoprotein LpqH
MHTRFVAAVAALIVVASAAGCSEGPNPERAKIAKITVDGKTLTTQEITCTQVEWSLIIKTTSGSMRTDSYLQLEGEKPIAKAVNIANFDGFYGVAGETVGRADVSLANNDYVIAGAAEGSGPGNPGKTRSVPFRIETSC